jgi:hypothetical protein
VFKPRGRIKISQIQEHTLFGQLSHRLFKDIFSAAKIMWHRLMVREEWRGTGKMDVTESEKL